MARREDRLELQYLKAWKREAHCGSPPSSRRKAWRCSLEPLCEQRALLPGDSCATARPTGEPGAGSEVLEAPPGAATSEAGSHRRCSHGECCGPERRAGFPPGQTALRLKLQALPPLRGWGAPGPASGHPSRGEARNSAGRAFRSFLSFSSPNNGKQNQKHCRNSAPLVNAKHCSSPQPSRSPYGNVGAVPDP